MSNKYNTKEIINIVLIILICVSFIINFSFKSSVFSNPKVIKAVFSNKNNGLDFQNENCDYNCAYVCTYTEGFKSKNDFEKCLNNQCNCIFIDEPVVESKNQVKQHLYAFTLYVCLVGLLFYHLYKKLINQRKTEINVHYFAELTESSDNEVGVEYQKLEEENDDILIYGK